MFTILKSYIRYKVKLIHNNSYQIEKFIQDEPNINYDLVSHRYSIKNTNLNWNERMSIRRNIMLSLRGIPPKSEIKIDNIFPGYYDQCLERYLFQKVNQNRPNDETCWFKFAQNNKCIGWSDPNIDFDTDEKSKFIDTLRQENIERDNKGFIFLKSNNYPKQDDKVLELYKNISKSKFSNYISTYPPIIVGHSLETNLHTILSGRHRIAVLRYLRSQNKISNLSLLSHIIEYPYESLTVTRPYTRGCIDCKWAGIFDVGIKGHQNFYVRDGIAMMRGPENGKGGLQQWKRIEPIFRSLVNKNKVLDVGAYKGLYCLKAIEYGASSVTALEPQPDFASTINKIKTLYHQNDLNIIIGDFYNTKTYQKLFDSKFDTLFFFGIIHHLLRIGIQKGILLTFEDLFQKISPITKKHVLIEFSMPKESSFEDPFLNRFYSNFSEQEFKKALNNHFPNNKNLGRCNYRSGNAYGRYMYYGTK